MKTIKAIETKKYSVSLVQLPTNDYRILFEHLGTTTVTGRVTDFNLALQLFDETLVQVQGH